MVDAPQLSAR